MLAKRCDRRCAEQQPTHSTCINQTQGYVVKLSIALHLFKAIMKLYIFLFCHFVHDGFFFNLASRLHVFSSRPSIPDQTLCTLFEGDEYNYTWLVVFLPSHWYYIARSWTRGAVMSSACATWAQLWMWGQHVACLLERHCRWTPHYVYMVKNIVPDPKLPQEVCAHIFG